MHALQSLVRRFQLLISVDNRLISFGFVRDKCIIVNDNFCVGNAC